jgi:hypothetical protein
LIRWARVIISDTPVGFACACPAGRRSNFKRIDRGNEFIGVILPSSAGQKHQSRDYRT